MDAFEAISLPEPSSILGKRTFSVTEANRSLTLVQRIVADIVQQYSRLCGLHNECRRLDAEGSVNEAEEVREEYVAVTDRLSELREELEEIGCELKDYASGLVDFPAQLGDRQILLCWKLGEDRVSHWHDLDTGFAGRQSIPESWQ